MQMAAAASIAALGGLIMGSFVTVVAHRVPRQMSIVGPRSRCPDCGAQIAAHDNVPVVSWLLLGGHGRCCGARISARYPATEIVLATLYAATAIVLAGDAVELALGLVLVTTLVAITLTDLEQRLIPNRILLASAAVGLTIATVGDPGSLPERAAAAAGAGGLFLVVALVYPRGMGLGDVKLAALLGLFLGRSVVPALLIALVAGSLVGAGLILKEGAAARKRAIPFGPFLALGGVAGLLAGPDLIGWYLATFS
jgi:leader peptidase (prepilin peptidase)/N-methyltransferase